MGFSVFLQAATGRGADESGQYARHILAPFLTACTTDGFAELRTADGGADLYGLDSDALMLDHLRGERVWDVLVEVARAADFVIIPVGCPVCVTRQSAIDELPDELRRAAVLVSTGAEVLAVVRAG